MKLFQKTINLIIKNNKSKILVNIKTSLKTNIFFQKQKLKF